MACGYVAKGRMEEPLQIVERLNQYFNEGTQNPIYKNSRFEGKHALVTAGPTVEELDPVRYLSNRASGKIGYALAESLTKRGAIVTLVTGPTHLTPPANVEVVQVQVGRHVSCSKNVSRIKTLCLKQQQYQTTHQSIHLNIN